MSAPADPGHTDARAWLGCALIVAAAIVLVVGLLVIDSDAEATLALVVGPAAVLVAAGAALVR